MKHLQNGVYIPASVIALSISCSHIGKYSENCGLVIKPYWRLTGRTGFYECLPNSNLIRDTDSECSAGGGDDDDVTMMMKHMLMTVRSKCLCVGSWRCGMQEHNSGGDMSKVWIVCGAGGVGRLHGRVLVYSSMWYKHELKCYGLEELLTRIVLATTPMTVRFRNSHDDDDEGDDDGEDERSYRSRFDQFWKSHVLYHVL